LNVPGLELPKGKQAANPEEKEEELNDREEGRAGANQASANNNNEAEGGTRSLSAWVHWVRNEYRNGWQKGKQCKLDKGKVQQLDRIGFDWGFQLRRPRQSWVDQLASISEFMARNGHCRIPKENPQLLAWVKHTRNQYRKWKKREPSSFSEERYKDLEKIGFLFDSLRGRLPADADDASHSEDEEEDDSADI
jgi:hypothetical protein